MDLVPPSILDPVGPDAARIAGLWWWLFGLAMVAVVVVSAFAVAVLLRRTPGPGSRLGERSFLVGGGLVLSLALLVPAGILTVRVGLATSGGDGDLTVEVVGRQWWWDIEYPESGVRTAHEIVVPTGVPVLFRIGSADVIHSFWIPNAGPKMDANPGDVNELLLRFDEPGLFWGACAEFCGLQHARMLLRVAAVPPDEFEAWIAAQQEPAREPDPGLQERGREIVAGGECIGCHTIRGVAEVAGIGPDLTHLASRSTFAGATVELTEERLRAFLADPDAVKRGVLMPDPQLTSDDLDAVVAYLGSLE